MPKGPPGEEELWFPRLIVVPLSSQEVDGVRKEKERLTTAINLPPPPTHLPTARTVFIIISSDWVRAVGEVREEVDWKVVSTAVSSSCPPTSSPTSHLYTV